MAYYDRIARKWHTATGHTGGAFKRLVLNDLILHRLPEIADRAILELGAGNGYFIPLMLRRFSGQVPSRIVITDQSRILLDMAKRYLKVRNAEYLVLDVRNRFPFPGETFDLILANMVFNEVPTPLFHRAFAECRRVLNNQGHLIAAVIHSEFVESLARRKLLRRVNGVVTMPGSDGLRLPVIERPAETYTGILAGHGFLVESTNVFATRKLLNEKRGLRKIGDVPIAMILDCRKVSTHER